MCFDSLDWALVGASGLVMHRTEVLPLITDFMIGL